MPLLWLARDRTSPGMAREGVAVTYRLWGNAPLCWWTSQLLEDPAILRESLSSCWDWPNYRSLWSENSESFSGNCGWCQQAPGIWWGHVGVKALESTVQFPWVEKWNGANPIANQKMNLLVFPQKNNDIHNIVLGKRQCSSPSIGSLNQTLSYRTLDFASSVH